MVTVKKSASFQQPTTYGVTPYLKSVDYVPTQFITKFLVKGERYIENIENIDKQNITVGRNLHRNGKSLVAVKLLSIDLSVMVEEVIISIYDKHIVIKPTSLRVKLDDIFIDPIIMFGQPLAPLAVRFKHQDVLKEVLPCHSLTYIPYFNKDGWFYDLPLYSRINSDNKDNTNRFVTYDYGCYGCARLVAKDHSLSKRRISVQSKEYPQDICTDIYEVTVYDNNAGGLLEAFRLMKPYDNYDNDYEDIVRRTGLRLSMPPCVEFSVKIEAFSEFVDKISSLLPEAKIVYAPYYMISSYLRDFMEAEAFLLTEIKYLQYLFLKGERETLVETLDDIRYLTLEDFESCLERYNYYLKARTFIPEIKNYNA